MEVLTAQNLVLLATFILGYFVYWLAYGRLRRSKGFVGPPVQAFYGNYEDFKRHSFQLHLLVDEYYKKYGKLFSFFHYNNEVKVVSDPKIINKITIKKFGNFSKRQVSEIWIIANRSSHLEVFCQKGVLKNLSKFTGRQHLCHYLFSNIVAGLSLKLYL